MIRYRIAVLVFVMSSLLGACGGGSAVQAPDRRAAVPSPMPTQTSPSASISGGKIQHVIIIVQENRTTDNLFNGFPGADTVATGLGAGGVEIALQPEPLQEHYDLGHEYPDFLHDYDGGKMDGFQQEIATVGPGGKIPPNPAYAYTPQSDVQTYFDLGERFTFADRMFQTNEGSSFPSHQYLISGTAAPSVGSDLLVDGNPGDSSHDVPQGGCDSPSDMRVGLIDQFGDDNYSQYPCFDHPTMMDLLDAAGLSWRYYEPQIGGFWDGPDAISHLRQSPADWADVVVPETTILSDVQSGALPAVSWVIPTGTSSDHPGSGDGGPSWVGSIANAIGKSQYWGSTVIFVTWDDWGGWYDHVVPTLGVPTIGGFRVPLLVISPYAKPGYVSHVDHDFGSLLKFVEANWVLPTLGYTDAQADDLGDCFDFSQHPLTYQAVRTKYPPSHFTSGPRIFTPPDSD